MTAVVLPTDQARAHVARSVSATSAAAAAPGVADRAIDVPGFDEQSFARPTDAKPAVLWFWDRMQTEAQIDARLESMHAAGFTETVIFRWFGDGSEAFFSQAWFDRIEHLLSKSQELGMKVWLDNDAQFPSGAAGGLIVNGGTVGDQTYAPRPDLKVKTLRAAGSAVRDGGQPIALQDLFGSSVVLDDGEVVANAASVPGITLLRTGADWTDYTTSASFRIVRATAGFMVRSSDTRNGYLVDVRSDGGVDLWRQQNGGFSLMRQWPARGAGWIDSPDAVHDIDITVEGSTLRITLDGLDLSPATGLTHFPSGRVGMRVDGTQHWRLRDLEVTEVPGGQTLFSNDFSDDSSVSEFDTQGEMLDDVVTVTARPASGAGATDLDQVVDITDDYLGDGAWDAPAGRWRLEAYQSVARGGDRDSYIDSMSYEAQQLYLEVIFDEYAERFEGYLGSTLVGFADDEPEVGRHGDDVPPWSPDLAARLEADGVDLAKTITAIHTDMGPEGDELRSRFYRTMSDQWVDAYWKTKYEWAEEHGVDIISNPLYDEYGPAGRLHESGNLMTMHQWAQIPGTDLIFDHVERGWARNLPREPASVAHQLGRPYVYDELMGATGWDKTVADVRRGTAMSAVRGINKALFHATFDDNSQSPFPPVFADDNVWWKFVPQLNTWTGRLMEFGRHQTAAQTALVQMQRAAETAQRGNESAVDAPFFAAQRALEDHQVDFDLLDEGALSDDPAVLAHAEVTENGDLTVGEMTYSAVVVPTAPIVSLEAMQRVRDLALAGGQVVLAGPAPTQELEGRDAELAAVMAQVRAAGDHVVETAAPSDAGRAAADLGRAAVTLADPDRHVRVLRHDQGGSTGYLLLNESAAPVSTDLTFPDAGVPAVWDPDTGEVAEPTTYRIGDDTTTLPMTLQPNVPVAVTVSPGLEPSAHVTEVVGRGEVESVSVTDGTATVVLRSERPGPVKVSATNGADQVTGVVSVPTLPADIALGGSWRMQLADGSQPVDRPLGSWTDIAPTYSGDATYTRSFEVDAANLGSEWTLNLGSVANAATVELNGQALGDLVRAPYTVDLGDALVAGTNTLRVTVTNTDANSRNQVRTSGLLGPVSLTPYATVEATLSDSMVRASATEARMAADGASVTVTATVFNTGSTPVRVRASAAGDGWSGVPGVAVRVPAGGSARLTGYGVPTDFIDDGGSSDLFVQVTDASARSSVLDIESTTVSTAFATPPTTAVDHVDLGDPASEAAHSLTSSPTSGTNVEAGLTRRYGGYRVPDAWYEFDLAAEPGKDLMLQGVETYNDMPQVKSYLVIIDGTPVATRLYSRSLTQEGTAGWRLLVPAKHIAADRVRVRFQSRSNPDLADPSLADVWAQPIASFAAPSEVVTADEPPTISGAAAFGRTLRARPGEWNLEDLSFGYQWMSNGSPVPAATAATYRVRAADIGRRLQVVVTATSESGAIGTARSARTAVVPKVRSRTTLRAGRSQVRPGTRVPLRVAVAPATGGVRAHGRVRLRVDGRTVRTVVVRGEVVRLDLRLRGRGVKRLSAAYLGTARVARSSSNVVRVRMLPRR